MAVWDKSWSEQEQSPAREVFFVVLLMVVREPGGRGLAVEVKSGQATVFVVAGRRRAVTVLVRG